MDRKTQIQPTQATRSQQTDAVFTRLMITAMRIYGDSALRKR
jgi:hypothetical protein